MSYVPNFHIVTEISIPQSMQKFRDKQNLGLHRLRVSIVMSSTGSNSVSVSSSSEFWFTINKQATSRSTKNHHKTWKQEKLN